MKTKSKNIRIAFWFLLGLIITFSSLALNRPAPSLQTENPTPTAQAESVVVGGEIAEDVGSTDGIVLVAVVIVLIIITPILLMRQTWSNGKQKKKNSLPN